MTFWGKNVKKGRIKRGRIKRGKCEGNEEKQEIKWKIEGKLKLKKVKINAKRAKKSIRARGVNLMHPGRGKISSLVGGVWFSDQYIDL